MKVLTWNIGSFTFLKYAKYFGIKFNDQKITHEYFQPEINGDFVSRSLEKINPDLIFLQEFYYPQDVYDIEYLKDYPHKKLIDAWYRKHSILITSKYPFEVTEDYSFPIIHCEDMHFIPIHLNSFSAKTRFNEVSILEEVTNNFEDVFILGDSNIWSRKKFFFFKYDKLAYKKLTQKLNDFSKDISSTTYTGIGLDKVFGSSNLIVTNITSPRIRGRLMDHYPIVFDID